MPSPCTHDLSRLVRAGLIRAGQLAAVSAAACLAYGVAVEPRSFRLRRVTVPVLPPGRRPIRVLHISDLHLTAGQSAKIAWVRGLAALAPDFIVNTGDNIAAPAALKALRRALAPFAGIPGVFVFGSNDYTGPSRVNPLRYFGLARRRYGGPAALPLPTAALAGLLAEYGWTDIQERRAVVEAAGTTLEVRGCGDAHIGLDGYARVAGPPAGETLLAVTHAPYQRVLDQMVIDQASLILAGHTHGGQVCLPGGIALTTNCDLPRLQAKGLSVHRYGAGWAFLHVSAGLGQSPYAPYRFCCPPEATLLTLVPRDQPA